MKTKHVRRAGVLCSTVAVLVAGVGFALPAAAQAPAQFHGAAVQKSCPALSKVGDTKTCTIRFRNQDDFGDSHTISEAWDVVDPGGLNIRVPAAGNLPIIAVSAGVNCAAAAVGPAAPIGLTFPCTIPGTAVDGGSNLFVAVEASFVVPPGPPTRCPTRAPRAPTTTAMQTAPSAAPPR